VSTPQRPEDSRSTATPDIDLGDLSSPLDPHLASIEAAAPVAARLPVTPSKKPAGSSSNSRRANILLGVAGVVAVAGIAFAGGRMTAPVAAAGTGGPGFGAGGGANGEFPGFGGGANGTGGAGGGFAGGGLGGASVLSGTIVSVASDSLTLKIGGANGNPGIEIKIPLAPSTAVHTQTAASSSALAAGQKVLVQLGAPAAGSAAGATPAPAASGAPRQVQAPASDVTIVAP
jgi:hypothetical protein